MTLELIDQIKLIRRFEGLVDSPCALEHRRIILVLNWVQSLCSVVHLYLILSLVM